MVFSLWHYWIQHPEEYPADILQLKIHLPHPLLEVECRSGHQQVDLIAVKPLQEIPIESMIGF